MANENLWIDLEEKLEALEPGFVAENSANKATSLVSNDNTHYPTTRAVSTGAVTRLSPPAEVDLSDDSGPQVVCTVPAGFGAIVLMLVMRDFSEQGNATIVFAWPGGAVTSSYSLAESTPEAGEAILLHLPDAATALVAMLSPAAIGEEGDDLSITVEVPQGSGTCVVDALGLLLPI